MKEYVNNFLPMIINDGSGVVERYGNYYITFIYNREIYNWKEVVDFHNSRCNDVLYLKINVRELFYKVDHIFPGTERMINQLLECNVKPENIKLIINYHSLWFNEDTLEEHFGQHFDILKIRHFEMDAVLRHSYNECLPENKYYGWNQLCTKQELSDLKKFNKKYLSLFGKPYKFFRIGTIVEMYKRDLLKDSITSALIDNIGLELTKESVSEFFDEEIVERALKEVLGPVDNIIFESPDSLVSNYVGYPYDVNMYKDTFMSIISETHGHQTQRYWCNNTAFFVTEKTTRTFENRHPFIILGSLGFLQKLRDEMGYMTFYELIDESYDFEEDGILKIKKAIDSAEDLVRQYENPRIIDIVEHNFYHQRKVTIEELKKIEEFILS